LEVDFSASSAQVPSSQIAQLEYPFRIERTELAPRSGGRGRQPGGLGLRRDYRLLADAAEGMYYIEQLDRRFGAAGAAGGGAGAPAAVRLRPAGGAWRSLRRGKGYLHLGRGDTVSFVGAGGGGYGRPGPSRRK
jgi:N-methylhydantoinase B